MFTFHAYARHVKVHTVTRLAVVRLPPTSDPIIKDQSCSSSSITARKQHISSSVVRHCRRLAHINKGLLCLLSFHHFIVARASVHHCSLPHCMTRLGSCKPVVFKRYSSVARMRYVLGFQALVAIMLAVRLPSSYRCLSAACLWHQPSSRSSLPRRSSCKRSRQDCSRLCYISGPNVCW